MTHIQTFPEVRGRAVRGRAGRDFRRRGRHRLRQGRRAGQARGRLSALLHRVVVGRDHARQEVLREIPAEGIDGRLPDRPAGRDHRQQPARGQAAHRLHGRHAGASCRRPSRTSPISASSPSSAWAGTSATRSWFAPTRRNSPTTRKRSSGWTARRWRCPRAAAPTASRRRCSRGRESSRRRI